MDFDDLKMAEDVIQVNKTLQIVSLKLFWISQPSKIFKKCSKNAQKSSNPNSSKPCWWLSHTQPNTHPLPSSAMNLPWLPPHVQPLRSLLRPHLSASFLFATALFPTPKIKLQTQKILRFSSISFRYMFSIYFFYDTEMFLTPSSHQIPGEKSRLVPCTKGCSRT